MSQGVRGGGLVKSLSLCIFQESLSRRYEDAVEVLLKHGARVDVEARMCWPGPHQVSPFLNPFVETKRAQRVALVSSTTVKSAAKTFARDWTLCIPRPTNSSVPFITPSTGTRFDRFLFLRHLLPGAKVKWLIGCVIRSTFWSSWRNRAKTIGYPGSRSGLSCTLLANEERGIVSST